MKAYNNAKYKINYNFTKHKSFSKLSLKLFYLIAEV